MESRARLPPPRFNKVVVVHAEIPGVNSRAVRVFAPALELVLSLLLPLQEARVGGEGLDTVAERGEAFDQVPHEVVSLGVRLLEEAVL